MDAHFWPRCETGRSKGADPFRVLFGKTARAGLCPKPVSSRKMRCQKPVVWMIPGM